MLIGAVDKNGSLLQSAGFAFACLARPLTQQRLTHAGIIQVRAVRLLMPLRQGAASISIRSIAMLRPHVGTGPNYTFNLWQRKQLSGLNKVRGPSGASNTSLLVAIELLACISHERSDLR